MIINVGIYKIKEFQAGFFGFGYLEGGIGECEWSNA